MCPRRREDGGIDCMHAGRKTNIGFSLATCEAGVTVYQTETMSRMGHSIKFREGCAFLMSCIVKCQFLFWLNAFYLA